MNVEFVTGDDYGDHNYVGMRAACTALGACLVPFTYLTVWDLTKSVTASSLSAVLLVFGERLFCTNILFLQSLKVGCNN